MKTVKKEVIEKRSYKEFEKDFLAFRDAKDNFLSKHGDVIDSINVRPSKDKNSKFPMEIETSTGSLFYQLYDLNN